MAYVLLLSLHWLILSLHGVLHDNSIAIHSPATTFSNSLPTPRRLPSETHLGCFRNHFNKFIFFQFGLVLWRLLVIENGCTLEMSIRIILIIIIIIIIVVVIAIIIKVITGLTNVPTVPWEGAPAARGPRSTAKFLPLLFWRLNVWTFSIG